MLVLVGVLILARGLVGILIGELIMSGFSTECVVYGIVCILVFFKVEKGHVK